MQAIDILSPLPSPTPRISVEHAKGLRQPREPAGPPGAWGPYGAPPGYGRLPPRIKRGESYDESCVLEELQPLTSRPLHFHK